MNRLLKVDEIALPDHHYLSADDNCYYLTEYTSHQGYGYSDGNDLISNLKKPMEKKGLPEWKWKNWAIEKIAETLKQNIWPTFNDLDNLSFVPIPPSKTKDHPLYDDRLMQILQKSGLHVDCHCDLISQITSTTAVHTGERIKPDELEKNYQLNQSLIPTLKNYIVLFDDVLTTGAHYVACRNKLKAIFPQKEIVGFFVARRVFAPETVEDFYI